MAVCQQYASHEAKIPELITTSSDSNTTLSSDQAKAELFAKYFSSVFTEEYSTTNTTTDNSPLTYIHIVQQMPPTLVTKNNYFKHLSIPLPRVLMDSIIHFYI